VPSGTSSNQIRLGNTAITYAGIQVAWTVTSDRRYKDNITPLGLGLGFISKLNPVSYVRKNDENKKTEYGLIAQEVEEVLKELGIENHGMLTVTDEGMYELRYNDLIAPMIKAIQELKEKSDVKDNEIANLKEENRQLRSEIQLVKSLSDEVQNLKQIINSLTTNSSDVKLTISGKEEK
jgi:galactitol-specific phosphotransferase system IIB component